MTAATDPSSGLTTTPRNRWQTVRSGLARILVVGVLALAGSLIYRALTRYSLDEVVISVTSVPVDHIVPMAGFATASYLCLTCFDALGVRYAGRRLPYPRVAMTSFAALSIGHNIGFAVLSSGAIRYRLYSQWGLRPFEIGKLILFCALTVGLGLMILGSLALLLQPALAQQIIRLDSSMVLALGTACMLLAAAYLVAAGLVRRPIGYRHWSLQLPDFGIALAQVVIGPLNFAFVAACLYQGLAATADVTYLGVATVYLLANVATLLSHVPGGLGVIEAVVLFLLPGQPVIGALILFRLIYFLAPLCLGSLLFALLELLIRAGRISRADR